MVTIKLQPFLLTKIITGQEFGPQIPLSDILPKLNTFYLSLVINTVISKCTIFALELYSLILPNSLIKFKYDLKIQNYRFAIFYQYKKQ